MPKVYLTAQARAEDAARAANEALRVAVATKMMRERITQKNIADQVGIAPVTLSRRLQNPSNFTLGELRRMLRYLGIGDGEKAKFL